MSDKAKVYLTEDSFYDVVYQNKCIRVAKQHEIYVSGIIDNFDSYFTMVRPIEIDDILFVDYSTRRYHDVIGYDLYPIMFPALAEFSITDGCIKFANLKDGAVTLDLGAYSGLSSIQFDMLADGRVIAVEPDQITLKCALLNFENYMRITGRRIDLLKAAVWEKTGSCEFFSEGNMGASLFSGTNRSQIGSRVAAVTLSDMARIYKLERVDFIKCDIEGAELHIFKDKDFFKKFKPRILIETHEVNLDDVRTNTGEICRDILKPYGYRFETLKEAGMQLSVVLCYPL